MDSYTREVQEVLGALGQYFHTMKGYITSHHPNRGTRLEKLIYDNEQLLEKFNGIVTGKTPSLDSTFHTVNLLQLITQNLSRMYDLLQFPLEVSDDLSSTRLEQAVNMFNDITRIYRLFIRDLQNRFHDIVEKQYNTIVDRSDFAAASACFRKYPASIKLYMMYQTAIMDEAYRTKNRTLQNDLNATLESDKSYVLDEKEWHHAFLSFNLSPYGPVCETAAALIQYIRSMNIKVDGDTLEQLHVSLKNLGMGLIVINRPQPVNGFIHKPLPLDVKTGISEERARTKVLEFFNARAAAWSVGTRERHDNYLVVESLGTRMRMMVPRARDSLVVHRSMLQNMWGHNDRPQRYNNLMTTHILKHWNRHVYEFMKSDIPPHEVVVRIESMQKDIIAVYRDDRSHKPWHQRVVSHAVQDAFIGALDTILGTELHDMRFYMVSDMNEQFVAACSAALPSDEPESREKELLVTEGIYHDALVKLARNNKSVFGILAQNEYILKTISDIILKVEDLRPRRNPDKSSADI